eukprot:2864252-Rhodomonas_salina.3
MTKTEAKTPGKNELSISTGHDDNDRGKHTEYKHAQKSAPDTEGFSHRKRVELSCALMVFPFASRGTAQETGERDACQRRWNV